MVKTNQDTKAGAVIKVADLRLNPQTRKVTRAGKLISLTAKEYALLEFLMSHTGEVVTRTMISEQVWNEDFDSFTNIIDVYIRYLRSKIDKGFSQPLLYTLRGTGYTLSKTPP